MEGEINTDINKELPSIEEYNRNGIE